MRSKASPYENGTRTPILVSWPGKIEPKNVEGFAHSIDLFPTIVAAAGLEPPAGLPGINLLDEEKVNARKTIFGSLNSSHNITVGDPDDTLQYLWCIEGDWKLLLRCHGEDTTHYKKLHEWDSAPYRLFNLKDDPGEKNDLAVARPEIVARLKNRIEAWRELVLTDKQRTQARDESQFFSLFDGDTLQGWEGNENLFRVEQEAIVGGNLKDKVVRNEFLTTTKEYGNFELRLQFKVLGKGANAGVQFRTRRIPNHHEVIGYQADLGDEWWGCLYDESRRKVVLAGPAEEIRSQPVRMNGWNDYRILCQGKRIQLWINGTQTVDYTEKDAKIAQRGVIALQIHSGPPMEAWYRNIRIKPLD
jgi:hypothetical protein